MQLVRRSLQKVIHFPFFVGRLKLAHTLLGDLAGWQMCRSGKKSGDFCLDPCVHKKNHDSQWQSSAETYTTLILGAQSRVLKVGMDVMKSPDRYIRPPEDSIVQSQRRRVAASMVYSM